MRTIRAILLATVLSVAPLLPAHAQLSVFDVQNYTQNLLEAARALQQINNQIQALQNQAMMLQNMATELNPLKDVSQLAGIMNSLTQIGTLMNQAQGIAYNVNAISQTFSANYPTSYPSGTTSATITANAQARWQNSMSAFQDTLKVQAQVVRNVQADANTLKSLTELSQNATGNLAVSQAGNQLLALSVKQQLQIQNLLAAQYRSSALDQARKASDDQDGQTQFQTFLGGNNAYTPN
jgi:P-type conjugative transfer protein TrbJ